MENTNNSRFTNINQGFNCENCGKEILPRKKSCRNHCPFCLTSKHVDDFPGDRANPCQGLMEAVGYILEGRNSLKLEFRCKSCGERRYNIAATEDSVQPDNFELILKL